jgi:hypothetical protein
MSERTSGVLAALTEARRAQAAARRARAEDLCTAQIEAQSLEAIATTAGKMLTSGVTIENTANFVAEAITSVNSTQSPQPDQE